MIEAPVAKGLIAVGAAVPTLVGVALMGTGAYYLYKRYRGKDSGDQATEAEIVESSVVGPDGSVIRTGHSHEAAASAATA